MYWFIALSAANMTTEEAILGVFERRAAPALFVTEIEHGMIPRRNDADVSAALQHLIRRGEIIIVTKPAPDPHLIGADLRIAARTTPTAAEAIEAVWHDWLGEFLAQHRCS